MVGYHSLRGSWSPDQVYADLVTRICLSVVRSPAEVAGYLAGFTLGLRFLTFGTIVCLAVFGRGNLVRRRSGRLPGPGLPVVMAFVDATLVVLEVLIGVPVGPTTLLGNFAAVGVAVAGPHPDGVPQLRPAHAERVCRSPSDPGSPTPPPSSG